MKRLLSTTTVLSLALTSIQPWPLLAQGVDLSVAEDGSIVAPDGTVLCTPTAEQACDLMTIMNSLNASDPAADPAADAEAQAAEAARLADEAAAAADAARLADEAAAAADAARLADEAAAAADAARLADEAADAARLADEATAAEAEAAVPEAAEPAPDAVAEPAPEPAPEPAVEPAPEAVAEPVVEPTADPAADPAVEPAPEAIAEPAPEPAPEAAPELALEPTPETSLVDAPVVADAPVEPVEAPVVSAEEEQTLLNLLATPAGSDDAPEGGDVLGATAAAAAIGLLTGTAPDAGADATAPVAQPEPQTVTTTTVTEDSTRSSGEEFAAAPTAVEGDRRSGLSNLEKVGLLALGALVVGKVLSDGRRVVENTGDRVVVQNPDGGFAVYKDDDTLLRRPGATVRTETFSDGSSRSTVDRADGTQVVTIRDASGRVLRRAAYDTQGREVVLIDDLVREERIDVSTLPVPRPDRVTISTNDGDAALKAALAREEARSLGRSFSLRQIREIPQVRALAATIDVDNITFDSGSAVINPTEARKLASIGRIMDDILRDNPGEVFLIEGHTDAVGRAANNLALSDRRAESVALALTEYFGIPPENMVVQGYGESELRVPTEADERRNRRAVVRIVTPLMTTASLR